MVNGDSTMTTMTTMTRLAYATLLMSAWATSGQAEEFLRKDGVEGRLLGTKTGTTAFLTCHKVRIDLDKIGKHDFVATDVKCPSSGVVDQIPKEDTTDRTTDEVIYRQMIEKAASEAQHLLIKE